MVTAAKLIGVSIKHDYILRTPQSDLGDRIMRHAFCFPRIYQHSERQKELQRGLNSRRPVYRLQATRIQTEGDQRDETP